MEHFSIKIRRTFQLVSTPLDEYNEVHPEDKIDKTTYRMSSFNLLEGVLSYKERDLIYRDMRI